MRLWWRARRVPAFSIGIRLTVVRAFDFIAVSIEVDAGHHLFSTGASRVDGRHLSQVRSSEEAS